ncbi:hypothetical protein V6M85_13205 [Sulfolobus tengchongensis]|uniref:Uncharacterized protein n=1 Tax=Sulfolobus tengchongensis TaxID=207809 RepID=A0AAX4KZX3_9CREN
MKSRDLMIFLLTIDSIAAFLYSKNYYIIIYTTIIVFILVIINKFILKKVED